MSILITRNENYSEQGEWIVVKKFLRICVFSILVAFAVNFSVGSRDYVDSSGNVDKSIQKSIASKIIRFHVIANSDTQYDQDLKLKVRDSILAYISPKLKNSSSIEESRKILKENDKKILEISQNVVKSYGYNYGVRSTFCKTNFPIKTYGNITLPQGRYEAYRVIIGQGKGQNWWCVMFPPLCFVDISKGQASYKDTEKKMRSVLNEKEYDSVDNGIEKSDTDKKHYNKIQVKFKIVDVMKKLGL